MEYSSIFVCLMGMGTVFFGLICLIALTYLMSAVVGRGKKAAPAPVPAAPPFPPRRLPPLPPHLPRLPHRLPVSRSAPLCPATFWPSTSLPVRP